jgi:beta-amylase
MMPLTTVRDDLSLEPGLQGTFQQLREGGVDGIMVDVWWGLVEREGPKDYNFQPYVELATLARDAGLKMQVVMSFHRCGGNVGDTCDIPIPQWARDVSREHPIYYVDRAGRIDEEVISLFADDEAWFQGRTPIDIYGDFMGEFRASMDDFFPSTVVEIMVGMGAAGELRYPSYQLDRWEFCGIGEFQSYDANAVAKVKQAAEAIGRPEWGTSGGPGNAGQYNSRPWDTAFFSENTFDNFRSDYGRFFLNWYQGELITHGDKILAVARDAFGQTELSVKISGIHWFYHHSSHAAELTAGFYNTDGNDGYGQIADMLASHNATFCFTCLEMKNSEQDASCNSGPFELVRQTKDAADSRGIYYAGENALPRYDQTAYNTMLEQSAYGTQPIHAFTYLRLTDQLLQGQNWDLFRNFVNDMQRL